MRKTLMAASVLALMAGSASAATVSYNSTVAVGGKLVSPLSATSLAFAGAGLTLPQFDTTLGTLISVTLDWTASLSGTATVTKGPNAGTVFNASTSAFISGTGPSSLAINLSPTDSLISSATAFAGNEEKSYDVDAEATDVQSFVVGDTEFAAFLGTGNVAYLFDGINFSSSSQTGGAAVEPDTFAGVDVVVTYEYDVADVPVPAALPLLATAFGALGLMRLRRKA